MLVVVMGVVVTGIGFDVLDGVNVSIFDVVVTTLRGTTFGPVEAFSC